MTKNDVLLLLGCLAVWFWFFACSGKVFSAELDLQFSPTIQHRIEFTEDNIQLGIFYDGWQDHFYIGYEDHFNIRLYHDALGVGYAYDFPVDKFSGKLGVEDIGTDWATAFLDIRKKGNKGGVHLKLSQGLETDDTIVYVGFLCIY